MTTDIPLNADCPLPDPAGIHTQRELVAVLRLLKDRTGLTYRQLESRARRAGHRLPRSTIASVLARTTLPREEFVTALVRACGLNPARWQEAHRRIAGQAGPTDDDPHESTPRPWQMPYCAPGLRGHDKEVDSVVTWLTNTHDPAPVQVITGPPGVGKSVVALRAVGRAAAHYPDGQLYVELRRPRPMAEPLPAADVVDRLLRGFGFPPAQLPAGAAERAALLRTTLTERRVLVMLDDAASAAQIRSLVPARKRSALLVTSRFSLVALHGSRRARLRPLPAPEAEAALRQLLGDERAGPSSRALRELASYCGGLPLMLRITAARLAARTDLSVDALASRLADERDRLGALRVAGLEARASLADSYQDLTRVDDADRTLVRTFLFFGRSHEPEIRLPHLADMLEISHARAEWAVEQLLDSHLVEVTPAGRYRMHDLLRCFARELAEREQSTDKGRWSGPIGMLTTRTTVA
ncbi:NB-ARC domain-containing protein [Streptomyces sp. AK04-3B]|uniref:NB-ARC domain-containing protein n=1 Tax=Streptomyces sp. AK04-3B TaxID=3028650 RepID=UPI0029BEB72E|nr:NB-ARC domain-containing protein [Streptomyces sp. AK04-3B]MDX3798903.1 NB-ARC domain-containing protein [Streptomyces sp. AK04-3B]